MNRALKGFLYVALLAAACVLAVKFSRAYSAVMRSSPEPEPTEELDRSVPTPPAASNPAAVSGLQTNAGAGRTNVLLDETNVVSAQAPAAATNRAPADPATATNALASARQPLPAPASGTNATAATPALAPSGPTFSTLLSYGAALFLVAVSLSLLLAHDCSSFVAERFHKFILSDEGEGFKAPEYERAEQVWADGRPLEAIQLMRDYLKKHPRELYVSIRIAEIYEKELGNYLAAALEYEEVLKHRLRPEQWGWNAVHLANLYSGKLNQTDKAIALLRRIDADYGQTAAAVKARARLSQLEGEAAGTASPPEPIEEDPRPPSNLPKGFRPRDS